jgi:arsenite-transporting ATPase
VLVVRAEALVVAETRRYAAALTALHIATAAVLVQALPANPSEETRHALTELEEIGPPLFALPHEQQPPVGVAAIRELTTNLREVRRDAALQVETRRLRRRKRSAVTFLSGGAPSAALALVRSLTIVGGKGGVGKTTVSTALALAASLPDQPGRVLLISTDPAPSVGDALGIPDAHWARRLPQVCPGVPRLDIWQMDASAAFEDLRDRYRERIDELFEAWLGRGIDAAHDRTILRDLLALAPPGIDELYALSALGELLANDRYVRLIVDPAPTGHLLRLLEMPAVAVDWSHRLMRLLLKYREIASLGDLSQELVAFSRRTRALDQLLHDAEHAGLVLVTLDEPVVVAESIRLSRAIRGAGIEVLGAVVNRVGSLSNLLADSQIAASASMILAPEADQPLIGVDAIARWCRRWQARD